MNFPFGQPLKKVKQGDTTPKKVFVLGVYASAVHARWLDANGKQKVSALAVASEPCIFWKGENAEEIINKIEIPPEVGTLTSTPNRSMNGPSGKALDKLFLEPLGFTRDDAWLCDLLPESRMNRNQQKAIEYKYNPVKEVYGLPETTIPLFDKAELGGEERIKEILGELEQSQAEYIILLGDLPIYHFLYKPGFSKKKKSADFGDTANSYGKIHETMIQGKKYKLIPLCHPRQADRLGMVNGKWGELHDGFVKNVQVG